MARRIKVADLLPEPLEIELPDGSTINVPPLGVDDMLIMFEMEAGLTVSDPDLSAAEIATRQHSALVGVRDFVVELIRRADPDAFWDADGADAPPNWPANVAMAILAALAGNDTVAEAVKQGILGTASEIEEMEAESERERAAAADRGETQDEDTDPTISATSSPTPSSDSVTGSNGDLSGGEDSPGPPSSPISEASAAGIS